MLVPKSVFRLSQGASREAYRYQLTGVNFSRQDDGTCRAVATDGKQLHCATWEEDSSEDFPDTSSDVSTENKSDFSETIASRDCVDISSTKLKKEALRTKPVLRNVLIDEYASNGRIPMVMTDGDTIKRVDGERCPGPYPSINALLSAPREEAILINPNTLLSALKTLITTADIAKSGSALIELSYGKKGSPMVMRFKGTHDNPVSVQTLVMPLIIDNGSK